ncbi:hypothetical protein CROQUDRAFT_95728 [Cronartium quercuum f. sp. fusiforme G11]|uniref:Uncharacterized protein n=1 Tax=Cronartium quercuum f. sp. fusiforme G11 TaxID=708437 RepID=A0A9P6T9R7_9BASI|nr:hypothetical protein CROQUDRAFT_95728 [Cronartium quercuum f. sp. fusiforme G11]
MKHWDVRGFIKTLSSIIGKFKDVGDGELRSETFTEQVLTLPEKWVKIWTLALVSFSGSRGMISSFFYFGKAQLKGTTLARITDTTMATLSSKEIRKMAQNVKGTLVDDLKKWNQHYEMGTERGSRAKDLIDRFSKIKDITIWDGADLEHLVHEITKYMENITETDNDHLLQVNLEMIKCIGYFNPNAQRYFVKKFIQQEKKKNQSFNVTPLERLIKAVPFHLPSFWGHFNTLARYNEFVDQVKFECTEALEKIEVLEYLKDAVEARALPADLQVRLERVEAELKNQPFKAQWPMIDKGYFEDTLQVIRNCELIIAYGAIQPGQSAYDTLQPVVKTVYMTLNHLWKFNIQDQFARKFLMDLLIAKDIQRSIYLHVLCDPEFKRKNSQREMLDEFGLIKILDDSMKNHLENGMVTFILKNMSGHFLIKPSSYSLVVGSQWQPSLFSSLLSLPEWMPRNKDYPEHIYLRHKKIHDGTTNAEPLLESCRGFNV